MTESTELGRLDDGSGPAMRIAGRTLVTGAGGLIGRPLVAALVARGVPVRVLSRSGRLDACAWRDQVEVQVGDLTQRGTARAAAAGCAHVFHLAAELRDPSRFHATNVEGTAHLLEAATAERIAHVVLLSSVGVMGATMPGAVDESAVCQPGNDYERSKHESEQLARRWACDTGRPLAVLRPTIVFGERRGQPDSFLALLRAIRGGRFRFVDRRAVANYVFVEDVVSAGVSAAAQRANGVYIIADSCPLVDFVAAAAGALDVPPPTGSLPMTLALVAAMGMEALAPLLNRRPPLTRARVRALASRTSYSAAFARTTLGWQPAVGYRAGLRHTVAAYRALGQL